MKRARLPTFDEYYAGLFTERWDALKSALAAEPSYETLGAPLTKPYYLDRASVLAASALGVQPGERVLDLCAAPGGKSLVLSLAAGAAGSLTVNDRSSERRARLRRVLEEYLPPVLFARVRITGFDGARWGLHERDAYDAVLADVPCSSERHLLAAPRLLERWSPARTRHLAYQAYALLAAALDASKPGGRILYCTCALSPLENDEVLRKLADRRSADFIFDTPDQSVGERTELGWEIWPDRVGGLGPIFFARLRKTAVC